MTDQTNQDVSNSPGRILRAAREELSFSVNYVADALHLRPAVVQSIENEEYDSFSSIVFLKGYFRSYCRLVNLHEERMIELLDAQLKLRDLHEKEIAKEAKQAKQARKNTQRGLIGSVIFVIAILAYLTFTDEESAIQSEPELVSETTQQATQNLDEATVIEDAPLSGEQSADASIDEPKLVQDAPDEAIETKESISPSTVSQTSETPKESASSASQTPASSETLDEKNDDSPEQIKPIDLATPDRTAPEVVSEENISAQAEPVASIEGRFEASFSGDCWFTLKDSSGKTLFAALKRDGQTVDYTGNAPFRIVLGDARVASIKFNGEQVDLTPYTRRNGRAELSLGKVE